MTIGVRVLVTGVVLSCGVTVSHHCHWSKGCGRSERKVVGGVVVVRSRLGEREGCENRMKRV